MRSNRHVLHSACAALLVAGMALLPPARAGAQGVSVSFSPANLEVAPGDEFDLDLVVTQAGSPFNGFDAVVGYDPAALTQITLSPLSLQEGAYMTGACGSTFHRFHAGASSDTITDVLLCDGVSLPGPGQIYRLHFKASTTPQVTVIRYLPGLRFYNAGLYVTPVTATNVVIGIGMPSTTGVGGATPGLRLALRAAPNPARDGLAFIVESDSAGDQTLTVLDLQGRVIRRLASAPAPAGMHTLWWDGRDGAGTRLSPGVYLAKLEVAGRSIWSRVTLIH